MIQKQKIRNSEDVPLQRWPDGMVCACCHWMPACRRSCLEEMAEVEAARKRLAARAEEA